jgi:hypothetical protein
VGLVARPLWRLSHSGHYWTGYLAALNAYHEMRAYDAMLRCFYQALKLEGRLVLIEPDDKLGRTRTKYEKEHLIRVELVKADAARNNFQFVERYRRSPISATSQRRMPSYSSFRISSNAPISD